MGQLIQRDPERLKVLGAGRRASTLRSRNRSIRKYLSWLTTFYGILFPDKPEHCSAYLDVKASELCTRRALKEAHRSMGFLELSAGVEKPERVTNMSIYNTIFEELLVSTSPRSSPSSGPRKIISMLKSLEALVSETKTLSFIRIYSWWVLLQNWGILRFSDHRGLRPQDIAITNNTVDAVLSRSKTTCEGLSPERCSFCRDYLLPTPADNNMSCKQQEMRYELGDALQNWFCPWRPPDHAALDSALRQMLCAEPNCVLKYEKSQEIFFGRLVSKGLRCLPARCASTYRQSSAGCCFGVAVRRLLIPLQNPRIHMSS